MLRFSRAAVLIFVAAPLLAFACDADLESSCRDGTCGGGLTEEGSGGGAGGACNIDDTHGFPCPVYKVISENCHECHVPGGIGPFTLTDYEDTQKPYGPPDNGIQIWQQMKRAINPDASLPRMPLGKDANGDLRWPMSQDKLDVMNAWFATCESAEGCDQVSEGGGAEGGSGGSGGTGGSGGSGGLGGN